MSEWIFDDYLHIATARLAHLASLGLALGGKRVLEVGCGIGILTHFFEERDCEIVSTDGQAANVVENLRRHPWREGSVFMVDLEDPNSHKQHGTFDVMFCYGLLYHLGKPAECIASMTQMCTGLFLLETRVNPHDNGKANLGREKAGAEKAIHGRNCRPARDWTMARLKEQFKHVYVTQQQPNHPFFPTKWPGGKHSRAVFVASHSPLDLPTLSEMLLLRQNRYQEKVILD